jgi:hypothetical protein
MGERKIFRLMKWERILDMISQFTHVPSLVVLGDGIVPFGATSTCILLLGTRV